MLTTAAGCGNVDARAGGSGGTSAGGLPGVAGVTGSGGHTAAAGGGSPGNGGRTTGAAGGVGGAMGIAAGAGGAAAGTGGDAGAGAAGTGAGVGGMAGDIAGVGGGAAGVGVGAAGAGGRGVACSDASGCADKPPTFRVLRVGDGQTALSAASTAVFVEERRIDGTLVSTIALPVAASGITQPFTMAGAASSEGALALS
jgi:hypothetical protein